jgi:hypothetical protein
MKHIDIRKHFIRDIINKGLIDIIHIPNSDNPADIFTKPLAKILHQRWCQLMRLDLDRGGVLDCDPVSVAFITL